MSGSQQVLIGGAPSGGYQIERSLRFNSADTAYLNRTFSTPTSRNIWTWSGWIKRSALGNTAGYRFFEGGDGTSANSGFIGFGDGTGVECIRFYNRLSSTTNIDILTTAVFRDVSAWYHVVVAYDSAQVTQANKLLMYVNGVNYTWSGTAPSSSQTSAINTNTYVHNIGVSPWNTSTYFSGYLTEINFIDGQALTPSSFGQTNASTGVWEPVKYTGTYGTNGFYLNFSDNSNTTSTTLGKDSSGNGNNWTPNGFSVASGVGNDSLVDTPTSYGTDTGVGGEVRGNYATLNPLLYMGSGSTKANGNLQFTGGGTGGPPYNYSIYSTFTLNTGKWYWEVDITTVGQAYVGMFNTAVAFVGTSPVTGAGPVVYGYDGKYYNETAGVTFGDTFTSGDVIGIAVDFDNKLIWFRKNGAWQASGNPSTGSNGKSFGSGKVWGTGYLESGSSVSASSFYVNFGQRAFRDTAPSGFKALCTQNLPPVTIGATSTTQADNYFDIDVYTGIAGTYTKTGLGFQPDLIWGKARNAAAGHRLVDAVRGGTLKLATNLTDAESTDVAAYTFTSDGYSIPGGVNHNNSTGTTYAAWLWKANGAGSSNTAGSITSTVSANTTSGFSIVTWSGPNNNTTSTVGHGLGVAPSMVIYKDRADADNWNMWHSSFTGGEVIYLNLTNVKNSDTNVFNNTAPTSTLLTVKNVEVNGSSMVAYCFAAVEGYSAFGSYTGNGSTDGPFVYTGFRPRYVLIKRTDTTENWYIKDTLRPAYNVNDKVLYANHNYAEGTEMNLDILSNGFKARGTDGGFNASGGTYIYAAFAESPFKYSLAR